MDPLPHSVISKLIRELKEIQQNAIDGVKVLINEENICDVQAEYEGPAETPYEGGIFKMRLVFGSDFPRVPPKGYFITKIFHPNVSSSGEICVNVLKRDWNQDLGLRHVLTVIRCLLIEPNPESALNEEAGKLLLESFEEFATKARLMTDIHAKKQIQILTATGGANALNAENCAHDPKLSMKSKVNPKQRPAGVDKKRSLRRL